jgi:hypothetical protein
MATVNHSRGARLSRRFGADRPRTHPKRAHSPAGGDLPSQPHPTSPAIRRQDRSKPGRRVPATGQHSIRSPKGQPSESPADSPLFAVLPGVRLHLEVARATATVCALALKGQSADSDTEVSIVLQRSVADEIDRQIERLDAAVKEVGHGR